MPSKEKDRLEEHEGAKCPKCETVFLEKTEKCPQCDIPTEPTKYYTRLCVERWAFIGTVVLLIGLITLFIHPENALIALGLSAWLVPAAYWTAHYFTGIGGFTERFPGDAVPDRAHLPFSWPRYFSEFVRVIGVIVALLLAYLVFGKLMGY